MRGPYVWGPHAFKSRKKNIFSWRGPSVGHKSLRAFWGSTLLVVFDDDYCYDHDYRDYRDYYYYRYYYDRYD
jgi:hypothetical protein